MASETSTSWRSLWLTALLFCVLFLLAASFPLRGLLHRADATLLARAMDWSGLPAAPDVAVIAIDQKSVDNVGDWPWQRSVLTQVIDQLADNGARRIGLTVRLDAQQNALGRYHLKELRGQLDSDQAMTYLHQALDELDTDASLAASIARAGNVYLVMDFPGHGQLARDSMPSPVDWGSDWATGRIPRAGQALQPLPAFAGASAGMGHVYMPTDPDGTRRRQSLLVASRGQYYPALAVLLASSAGMDGKAELDGQGRLNLGGLQVPADSELAMQVHWYPQRAGHPPFSVDSFWDVFAGNTPADKFRDKIVLLGPTDARIARLLDTPLGEDTPELRVLAHQVSTLAAGHYTLRPAWSAQLEWAVRLAVAAWLVLAVPRLRIRTSLLAGLGLGSVLLVAAGAAYLSHGIWLRPAGPLGLLLGGSLLLALAALGSIPLANRKADRENAESHRMQGLAYLHQGQLDLAWDCFSTLPLDNTVLPMLYDLALALETRQKFERAVEVYDYMSRCDPGYRDIQSRIRSLREFDDTITLGEPGSWADLPRQHEDGRRRVGRYLLEEEIGKGAMGVVYRAWDPERQQHLALKTIALAEEFEQDALEEVRRRFLREAKSAARLDHPEIVRVYDAGEDHGVAYIAMERVHGSRLSEHTSGGRLLPAARVMALMARAAEALQYAHSRGVVHRDIKPANLLYDSTSDQLKIADFGVARFDDAQRTRTGLVLGTPSYMSPEQIEGENVTGSSDLFSLGVTLYQLLTGYLPFRADSLAKLMYMIANEHHGAVRQLNEALPECVEHLMDKALAKRPAQRFNSGAEMAQAIRKCLETMRDQP